jgi:dipeptidyl aminopeptidase/acylaminoacyl peptidase
MTKVRSWGSGLVLCAGLMTAPVFAQTAAVARDHDPRIGQVIEALNQAKTVRETALSPDGKYIAWNVGGGRGGSDIELAPLENPGAAKRLTACEGAAKGQESNAVFSPDSKQVAFFSGCTSDHKMAIFLADVAGASAPHQLAELNGFAKAMQWSPDGKRLSFLYVEGATRPSGALAAEKPPSGVIGVEGLEVQRVAAVDAASGQLTQITPAKLHVFEFDWSPDSSKLAYVAAPPPGENNWWVAKLYTQPVETLHVQMSSAQRDENFGSPTAILDPPTVAGPLHGLQIAVPRWSQDGTQIAFIGGLMSDQGSTGGDIYLMPAVSGEPRDVTPNITASPAWLRWKDNETLQFTEIASGASQLAHVSVSNPSPDYDRDVDFVLPESIGSGGLQMSISFAQDGTAAMIRSSFASAPEVWTWTPAASAEGRHFTRITSLNDGLKPVWGLAEPWQWTNEGYRVDGWLLLPAHYDPAKKYPLIVEVHGGPSSAVVPRWPGVGYGPVPFSALDYFVLMPNPRGSYGEGEKFTEANRKDFGYGDLRDILAGVDAVEKKYPIDDGRVGLTGWSYGGFMTMFAVTQTHRFKAAVAGAGISNWQSYYGENSIDQWMIPFFGASVYDDPAVYAKMSAINFIKNVKTPVLSVVGDRDGECPAPQSFEFWHALRDLGEPTELVVYPDEGHGFLNPEHRRDVLERALGWFEEYMP